MAAGRDTKEIGRRVQVMRERRGHSAAELGAKAGISAEALIAIERGTSTPSVGELINLAKALEVSAGQFFELDVRPQRVEVVRAAERWRVERTPGEGTTALSYSYEALSFRLSDRLMQPFLIEVHMSPGEIAQLSHHEGEEFVYVLEGDLELEVSGAKHHLCPGDSAYYDSRLPHVLRALSAQPARAIVVVAMTPPQGPTTLSALNRAF